MITGVMRSNMFILSDIMDDDTTTVFLGRTCLVFKSPDLEELEDCNDILDNRQLLMDRLQDKGLVSNHVYPSFLSSSHFSSYSFIHLYLVGIVLLVVIRFFL